jgi:ATP-dependent DNA helicase RecQ
MKPKVVSAFTATASPQVQKAIASRLFGAEPYSLVTADMDKPNIHYSVKQSLSPRQSILRLVNELPKPLIVFDQSRPGVRNLCEYLREYCTERVRFYHAGLSREEKEEVEHWFMESDDGVLVSTCAYGMGVDKKNIRAVVHFSSPPSVEAYIQEAGRAGRDGSPAEAVLIRNPWDSNAGAPGSKGNELIPVKRDGMPAAEAGCGLAGRSDAGCDDAREMRKKAFLEYGKNRTCRRASLLALMGAELSSPCSGCDVCDGRVGDLAEGMEELQSFFRHNRFRFTQAQSLRLLGEPGMGMGGGDVLSQSPGEADAGKALPDSKTGWLGTPPSSPAAGVLASWSRVNRTALLNEALH